MFAVINVIVYLENTERTFFLIIKILFKNYNEKNLGINKTISYGPKISNSN